MNWLDAGLLVVTALGALIGYRLGLIGAAITAVGVFIGLLLAGLIADDIGRLFSSSAENDTLITAMAYSIIMIVAVLASGIVAKLVKPVLKVFTLGLSTLADKIGSVALGLLIGWAVAGAVIIVLARLTYNFESYDTMAMVPENLRGGSNISQLEDQVARIKDAKEGLENTLAGSRMASIFIQAISWLPPNAMGLVPSDLKASLEILESNIAK